MAHQHN